MSSFELDRFCRSYDSCTFLCDLWRSFKIETRIFAFLTTMKQGRISMACIATWADRSEVALAATCHRLELDSVLSTWSVETPPIEVL